MIVRALDSDGDWTFGKGKNDYKQNREAVKQNIQTRILSFLGDCFFKLSAGIDWFNLLGGKDPIALNLAVSATILNTTDVTGLLQLGLDVDPVTRVISLQYKVQTSYSVVADIFQYDLNALG